MKAPPTNRKDRDIFRTRRTSIPAVTQIDEKAIVRHATQPRARLHGTPQESSILGQRAIRISGKPIPTGTFEGQGSDQAFSSAGGSLHRNGAAGTWNLVGGEIEDVGVGADDKVTEAEQFALGGAEDGIRDA